MQRQPLRILMISGIFYPKLDGSVIALSNLLRCIREHGLIVHLIIRKLPGTKSIEKWQHIPVVRVGLSKSSPIHRFMLSLNQARVGFNLMRKEHIDAIHAHGVASLLASLILSKLFHKPVVVTFHGFQRLWLKGVRWKRESTLALTHPLKKFLINHADSIIAQSEALKNVITSMYQINPDKVRVIPHAIEEDVSKEIIATQIENLYAQLLGK